MTNPLIVSIKKTKLTLLEERNIAKYKPFGVILFSRNISKFNQTKKLIKSIKFLSKNTLILIDQEGGMVNRFNKFNEFDFLDNYSYYKIFLKNPSLAKILVYLKSFITSYYLRSLDIDINTIPVLDLPIHNTLPMIKKRTFGPNIKQNIILNELLVKGANHFGIIPVMKHIPGHGITNKDSHFSLPVSHAPTSKLNNHLKVFKHFNHLPLAMTAHIKYLNWDKENISSFSPIIINKIIRKRLNYKGMIMTDDLMMKGNPYGINDVINLSNKAGIDILLDCSSDWDRYIEITKNFKKTLTFKNQSNSFLAIKNKALLDLKSININHYHHLYNEIIKLHGF